MCAACVVTLGSLATFLAACSSASCRLGLLSSRLVILIILAVLLFSFVVLLQILICWSLCTDVAANLLLSRGPMQVCYCASIVVTIGMIAHVAP